MAALTIIIVKTILHRVLRDGDRIGKGQPSDDWRGRDARRASEGGLLLLNPKPVNRKLVYEGHSLPQVSIRFSLLKSTEIGP